MPALTGKKALEKRAIATIIFDELNMISVTVFEFDFPLHAIRSYFLLLEAKRNR